MKKLLLLALLTITACSNEQEQVDYSQNGEVTNGGTIVSASLGEPTNLVPMLTSDSASHDISGFIYSSLLEYDKNLNLTGGLAESWEVSPDGLNITFKLRKGLKWQDGVDLTSADVLETFNKVTDENTRTAYAGDYMLVKSASTPDQYTFKVTYAESFAPALASWASLAILPKHIMDLDTDFNNTRLKDNPVGHGPYTLEKWQRGEYVLLKANPLYYKGEPHITYRRIRTIPDQDTQYLELKAGNIDTMALKPLQFTRTTEHEDFTSRFTKYSYLSNGYTYMGFNLKRDIFKDKLVRQALSYATPRDKIVKGLLHGQGQTIAGVFKPGTWANNDDLVPYEYDLAKAKELLTQSGWVDANGDGLVEKDGQPLAFTLVTNQGNDLRIKTAEVLQQSFAKIGVNMQIRVQEWSTFIANTINKRNFDAVLLGWNLSIEPDPYDIWHSSKTGEREFNFISFNNPRTDELMEKARKTFNQQQRKAYLDEFQAIIHDEQPYLFLYAPNALVAMHKRIKNIHPAPAGLGHNIEEWYVPSFYQQQ